MPTEEYWLFVDTETTGLPRRWDRPYAAGQNWPYLAQVAWQVYRPNGTLVKEGNYYLRVPPGSMQPSALAVHGLTPAFLSQHGQDPRAVLELLHHDLQTYRPRVIGYFLQLDFHVLGAALYRAGLPNLLPGLPQFCLMQLTRRPADDSPRRYLRLAELHEQLFRLPLPRLHDAYEDAAATARCFFELSRQGRIPAALLSGQPGLQEPRPTPSRLTPARLRWVGLAGLILFFFLLLWILV